MNLEKEVFDINLNDIIPNRFQPREIFNDEELQELSNSIKEHGVIQPIIVRKVGDKYEIIAGERRYRASKLAGKSTIPALIRDVDDKEAAKVALLENLQRSNLTPIEEAKTYQTILKIDNITQEQLASNLGKAQSTIANKLRLLTLSEEVQTALLNSKISERHARSMIGLSNSEQNKLLQQIINNKWTVRQLDEEILKLTGKAPKVDQVEDPNKLDVNVPASNNNINIANQPKIEETNKELPSIPEPGVENEVSEPKVNIIDALDQVQKNADKENGPSPVQPILPIDTPLKERPLDITETFENNQQDSVESPQEFRPTNIFDKLRVDGDGASIPELKSPNVVNVTDEQNLSNNNLNVTGTPNNIYDLRFAINNFRQAIQNTEKFGFKVKSSEYDTESKYQIVIEIEKH